MATGGCVELLEYVNEHVLECVICTEPFTQPKSLPCLHVFCRGCIKAHIDRNLRDGKYTCPSCNERHNLPRGGVDALRDAFLQKSLLEVASLIQKKPIPCSSLECTNNAKSACPTCGDFLCTDCESNHNRLRSTRGHVVTPIKELGDAKKLADFQKIRFDMCRVHETKPCELFCNTDYSEICNKCTFEPEHKGHDVITMEANLQELNAKVKTIKGTIDSNNTKLNKQKELVTKMLKFVKEDEQESMKKLAACSKEIYDMLHTFTKKTEAEIKNMSSKNQTYLQKTLGSVEKEIKENIKLSHQCTFLDSLPVPSALKVAKDIIRSGQDLPQAKLATEAELRTECPDIGLVLSTLNEDNVAPVWKSVVGFLSSTTRNDQPCHVVESRMPEQMQAAAVAIVQDAVWQHRQQERSQVTYHAIAELCNIEMRKKFPNSWNCFCETAYQGGLQIYPGANSFFHSYIAGISVIMYARNDVAI